MAACGCVALLHFKRQCIGFQYQPLGHLNLSEGKARADLAARGGGLGLLNFASMCGHKVRRPAHIAAAVMSGCAAGVLWELPGSLYWQPARSDGPVQPTAPCIVTLNLVHCDRLFLLSIPLHKQQH